MGVAQVPYWNVPYRRNPYFTGREELLTRLHEQLQGKKPTALTQPQAISGLGGIGKTQTAVEYAYRYRGDYQAVLWATTATRESLIADFVALAGLLHLSEREVADLGIVVAAVKRWLESHTGWLLILDNADDLEMASEFLPMESNGHILLTTRAQAGGTIANSIEVEKMEGDEGTLLLLRRAKLLASDAPLAQARETHCSQAEAIVVELDGLPLALDQAGAYIEETNCGLEGYLALYSTRRKELLQRRSKLRTEHPEPVATTWSLSFQKVEQANAAAADLLRLCAFLDPDAIPEELIAEGAAELGTILKPVAADAFELNEAIEVLRTYSLIKRNPETKTLNIHRLVQVVLKDGMDKKTQKLWASRAIRALNGAFPEVEFETWQHCRQCLPHALICAQLIDQHSFTFPEAADLLNKAAWYLDDHAQYTQAEALYQHALAIREKALGPDHSGTATILNNLALLYRNQGKYAQAEALFQRALTIYEQALPHDHPNIATTLDNLAQLYKAQGKYEQAEPLYQRALAIEEKALGPDHPETAITLDNLAQLYKAQGKYEQAEEFYQRALAIKEKALPSGHYSTAITLNNLAQLYKAQGKYEQAEPLYQRALTIYEKVLLPDHPYIATTLDNLTQLYDTQGKYAQAEEFYQRALAIYEQALPPDHPETAVTLNNLALLYQDQGKYAQAEPLYQRSLEIKEKALPPDHPDTATTLKNYARLLREMKRAKEAATLEERARAIRAKRSS